MKTAKVAFCKFWALGRTDSENIKTFFPWIYKRCCGYHIHTKELLIRVQEFFERVQYMLNQFPDSHCLFVTVSLILLLGSKNLTDVFMQRSLTRVQSVCHQLVCGTVNKFVWTSSRIQRSFTPFPEDQVTYGWHCEEVRCEQANVEPAGLTIRSNSEKCERQMNQGRRTIEDRNWARSTEQEPGSQIRRKSHIETKEMSWQIQRWKKITNKQLFNKKCSLYCITVFRIIVCKVSSPGSLLEHLGKENV